MRELLLTRHLAAPRPGPPAVGRPADWPASVSELAHSGAIVTGNGRPRPVVGSSESESVGAAAARAHVRVAAAQETEGSALRRPSPFRVQHQGPRLSCRAYTRLRATVCESHSNTASPACDRHTHDSKQAERIARDYCAAHAQRPLVWRGWSHGMGPYTVTNPGRCGAALQCRGLPRRQRARRIRVMILKGRTLRREAMVQPLRRPGGAKTH